jgi:hypothetical protein
MKQKEVNERAKSWKRIIEAKILSGKMWTWK